jgi:SAM-dependent methyltransferase
MDEEMKRMRGEEDRHGILMRGIGRWIVYSRARAWLGTAVELPNLLRGVHLPHGGACLDIATGIGWASRGLVHHQASVRIVALEYDATVLPRTREYLKSHGAMENVALCRADAKRLPFREGGFDLVLCMYGLHHFRGYLTALREIARVLKPGGTFALIDPLRTSGMPSGARRGFEVATKAELRHMVGEAGFEISRFRVSLGSARVVAHKRPGV